MGDTDKSISHGFYAPYILENVNLKDFKNIAWLGWGGENVLIEDINKRCTSLEKSDLYDIQTDLGASYWDINEDWEISDYDLVICLRTTLFVKNKNHFLTNLKKLINNNKKWYKIKTGPYISYLKKSDISSTKIKCLQDKYQKFFNKMKFSVEELYLWGKLNDRYVKGKVKFK